jgi:hypothetical protein
MAAVLQIEQLEQHRAAFKLGVYCTFLEGRSLRGVAGRELGQL